MSRGIGIESGAVESGAEPIARQARIEDIDVILFGAGLAIFLERASARQAQPMRLLLRRLLVLLAIGLAHEFLVWEGKLGEAKTAILGIVFYILQGIFSTIWLRHFRFGPFEWAWRSLTYGKWQPFRRHRPTVILEA